jgi:hypothetical protein
LQPSDLSNGILNLEGILTTKPTIAMTETMLKVFMLKFECMVLKSRRRSRLILMTRERMRPKMMMILREKVALCSHSYTFPTPTTYTIVHHDIQLYVCLVSRSLMKSPLD